MSGVIVIGAASGIGLASAEALVADGRTVPLWDIAPEGCGVATPRVGDRSGKLRRRGAAA